MDFSYFSVILLICVSLEVAYARGRLEYAVKSRSFENSDALPLFNDTATTPSTEPVSRLPINEVRDTRCPEQLKNITFNFSNMGLTELNEDIIETSDAVFLNLSHNEIRKLPPKAFKKLPNLQVLDLSANYIELKKVLQNYLMPNLVSLYINNNKKYGGYITEYEDMPRLSFYIGNQFPKLEKLHLRDTTGLDFPLALSRFAPNLRELDLSGNLLHSIDILLPAPETLSHLILDRTMIMNIPKYVVENLTKLSLQGNAIENLCFSDCFTRYTISLDGANKLEWLNLSKNKIRFFGDIHMHLPPLRYLDVSGNGLTAVPSAVNAFLYLEHLVLSDNMIESVPNLCFGPNLKYLDLSNNRISVLLGGLWCEENALEKLKLDRNMIETINAGAFDGLNALVDLDLSSNHLKSISNGFLPDQNHLEILRLNNNKITNLDDISLHNLTTLKELHLHNNPLTHLVTASIANLPSNFTIFLRNPTE